jgi:hypothetical protein
MNKKVFGQKVPAQTYFETTVFLVSRGAAEVN